MQGFAPADDLLLFRQKEAKPFLPVRGTTGNWSTAPNQDGSGTRSAQTAFAEKLDSGRRSSRAQRSEMQSLSDKNQEMVGCLAHI